MFYCKQSCLFSIGIESSCLGWYSNLCLCINFLEEMTNLTWFFMLRDAWLPVWCSETSMLRSGEDGWSI